MATIKNFGLQGVGSVVQFGKSNGKFKWDTDHFEATESNGSTLAPVYGATPEESSSVNQLTTKEYVDAVASGLDPKESVRAATTANIALSGLLTIDGVTLAEGDRVLVKNQTSPGENGIYTASSGAWSRASDHDGTPSNEISGGNFTFVEEGSTNSDTGWVLSTNGVISVGDPQTWVQFSAAGTVNVLGGNGIAVSTVGVNNTVSADVAGVLVNNGGSGDKLDIRAGTSGQALISAGTGASAAFGTLDISGGSNVNGVLAQGNGGLGTNVSGFADDDLLLISGTGVAALTAGAAGTILKGTGGTPAYSALDLTADVGSSVLPVANGGLGADLSGLADGALINFDSGTGDFEAMPQGSSGQRLTSAGAGADATWEYPTSLTDAAGDTGLTVNGADTTTLQLDTTATDITLAATGGTDVNIVLSPQGTGNVVMDGITFDLGGSVPAYSVLASQGTADTLAPVSATDGAGDKVLYFNDTTNAVEWVALSAVGGNTWNTIVSDSGTIAAASTSDTLNVVGGIGISTDAVSGTPDELTVSFNNSGMADTAVVLDDTVPFFDDSNSNEPEFRSWNNIIGDLNILTGSVGGALTAGDGVRLSGTDVIELDITNLTGTVAVTTSSEMVLDIAATGNHNKRTMGEVITDLDIVTATADGILVRTAADTYASRTIGASAVAGDEGISIVNGDGVSGNPTVGLDITGLTLDSTVTGTDELVMFNGTNNVKTTVADLLSSAANDVSRINDSADTTYVDTDEVASTVVVFAGGEQVAAFESSGSADSHMVFDTGTAGEVRIEATGAADADIRLVPNGNGQVFIGDSGDGVIQADDDSTLTVKGGDGTGGASGNLILEGGDGTGANADGSVILRAGNGSTGTEGNVCIQDPNEANITCFEHVASAVNSLTITNAATGGAPTIDADDSSDSNVDIVIKPKGTGVISVAGTNNYEDNVLADDDIPNKKYVDNAITNGATANAVKVVEWTVDLTSATTQAATDSIPAGSRVLRVMIDVTAVSNVATTIEVQGAGAAVLMETDDSDTEEALTYVSDSYRIVPAAGAPQAVVANAGATGSATIVVEYAVAA